MFDNNVRPEYDGILYQKTDIRLYFMYVRHFQTDYYIYRFSDRSTSRGENKTRSLFSSDFKIYIFLGVVMIYNAPVLRVRYLDTHVV